MTLYYLQLNHFLIVEILKNFLKTEMITELITLLEKD